MCGIIGVIGKREVAPLLVDGLRRLEYRGYDSAGVATLVEGRIERRRAEGKLDKLVERLAAQPIGGKIGIGHTRWATHGAPNETNAHPIATGRVAVVHNGIIENFQELKDELTTWGHKFETQTDTEVVAALVTRHLAEGLTPQQPAAIGDTLHAHFHPTTRSVHLAALPFALKDVSKVTIIGCGTSFHAGLVAKYWLERIARLPTEVEIASEFRYRAPDMAKGGVSLFISQSRETLDTLEAMRYAKKH